jgi:metallo-beta-lactamase family protein
MDIQFLGATGRVTGSCYLIRVREHQVLLECGLVQGSKEDESDNWAPFAFDASSIDAVVLSHADIDHSGRLPFLMKRGFSGPIYTQHASRALCKIMLSDSGYLPEQDAEWANRKRRRQGLSMLPPLYTLADGEAVIDQFQGLEYGGRECKLVFSGDLGFKKCSPRATANAATSSFLHSQSAERRTFCI